MIRPHVTQPEWASLVDLLRWRAAENADAPLFAFLPDGEDAAGMTITRGELDRRARAVAAQMQDLGLSGGRALLLYPPGLDFIAAFFGCLYAGVVAVPAHLPRLNRPMPRLRSIVDDATPCAVLTSSSQKKDARNGRPACRHSMASRCFARMRALKTTNGRAGGSTWVRRPRRSLSFNTPRAPRRRPRG